MKIQLKNQKYGLSCRLKIHSFRCTFQKNYLEIDLNGFQHFHKIPLILRNVSELLKIFSRYFSHDNHGILKLKAVLFQIKRYSIPQINAYMQRSWIYDPFPITVCFFIMKRLTITRIEKKSGTYSKKKPFGGPHEET